MERMVKKSVLMGRTNVSNWGWGGGWGGVGRVEAVRMDDGGRTMRLGDIVTAEMRLSGGEKQKTDLPTPALVLAGHKAKHAHNRETTETNREDKKQDPSTGTREEEC